MYIYHTVIHTNNRKQLQSVAVSCKWVKSLPRRKKKAIEKSETRVYERKYMNVAQTVHCYVTSNFQVNEAH